MKRTLLQIGAAATIPFVHTSVMRPGFRKVELKTRIHDRDLSRQWQGKEQATETDDPSWKMLFLYHGWPLVGFSFALAQRISDLLGFDSLPPCQLRHLCLLVRAEKNRRDPTCRDGS